MNGGEVELKLHAVSRAPKYVPAWSVMLDDLSNPPLDRVARVLGVDLALVREWTEGDCAPRVACLALFWLTSWGRSQVHVDAENDCRMLAGLLDCERRRVDELQVAVRRLLALGGTGAANDAIEVRDRVAVRVTPSWCQVLLPTRSSGNAEP